MRIILLFSFLLVSAFLEAQNNPILSVESYKLSNGLTVLLNRDTTATKVFGAVMVNAGAKHEDPSATGMAHYLEHLLFKGTNNYGTSNFTAEKPYLDSINYLYDELAKEEDELQKSRIQKKINQQAVEAAKYGLPNEFDKMLKSIGSTGVNAFTNYEMTYYHNSFPSHEIEKWLVLYSERFRNPVFRSFQSELEVVYEEKNRAMDNFERKIYEEASSHMFPNLPYGQWSVLGTVEHLKTPSLNRMYEFYDDNYRAENMALILSGNFDSGLVKSIIEREFSDFREGNSKPVELPEVDKIAGEKVVKKRMTPIKAGFIGYQTVGSNHEDRIALDVAEYLLSNSSETGYINQLMNNGELIYSGGIPMEYNDAGAIVFFYVPKIIQSLGAAEKKILDQIGKIKTGDFSDQLLASAKNDLIRNFNSRLESLTSRGILIGEAFNQGKSWEEKLSYVSQVDNVTKEEVKKVANKYFNENRLKLISRTGFPKKTKLEKPSFDPVVTDQKEESAFYKDFQEIASQPFQPKFLDFDKDIKTDSIVGGNKLYYSQNPVNDFFELTIRFSVGRLTDPDYIAGSELMNTIGAVDRSLTEFKSSFSALGIQYSFQTYQNFLQINLKGREGNLEQSLELISQLIEQPNVNENTRKIFLNKSIANRKLEKENPSLIGRALHNFVAFEDDSFYICRPSEKELKSLDIEACLEKYTNAIRTYSADIFYVGKKPIAEIKEVISSKLPFTNSEKRAPYKYLEGKAFDQPTIYFVHQKKSIQSQVYFHAIGETFKSEDYATMMAFNGYFGDGFSGLVLQEIREYRSLAYSAFGAYLRPTLPGKKSRFIGYIGCQGDKTNDAIPVMIDLLTDMPNKPERIEALKSSLKLKAITNYPDYKQLPFSVYDYQLNGFEEDPNRKAMGQYEHIDMDAIHSFYEKNLKGKPYVITIYGDKKRVDLEDLKKYGEVIELKEKDFIKF